MLIGIPYYACALAFAPRFKRACHSLNLQSMLYPTTHRLAVNAISHHAHNDQPLSSFACPHFPPSQFIVSVKVVCYIFHPNYLFICNHCNNILHPWVVGRDRILVLSLLGIGFPPIRAISSSPLRDEMYTCIKQKRAYIIRV